MGRFFVKHGVYKGQKNSS